MKKILLAFSVIASLSIGSANANPIAGPVAIAREVCSKTYWGQVTCFVVVEEGYNYGRDQVIDFYNNPPQVQIPQGQMEYYGEGYANTTPYYFNQDQGGDCNQFLYNC